MPEPILFQPASYIERLDLSALFPTKQPLEVELGAGDGSFLVAWAAKNPAHNFLGVERLLGRVRKAERKVRRAGLHNVRLLRIEARYFLEYLMPPNSLTALHVYFPDPWPKRKHRRHRLINEHFTEIAAAALVTTAIVYLRTDDADYFGQMTEMFRRNPTFEEVPTPSTLAEVVTDFERDFQARGVSSLRVGFRKR